MSQAHSQDATGCSLASPLLPLLLDLSDDEHAELEAFLAERIRIVIHYSNSRDGFFHRRAGLL